MAFVRPKQHHTGWGKWVVCGIAAVFLIVMLVLPLLLVFIQGLSQGIKLYWDSLVDENAVEAIKLTLKIALITVPLNAIFGIAVAWLLSKFTFRGKSLLMTLIDLPMAVSPVIVGFSIVLVFGIRGWLGPWLTEHDIQIIFALPGMVLATIFVTFPLVARELIPFMQSQGRQEEEVAATLGARGWRIFWRVTLPNIKWGLIYGIFLCNARAIGEFGAVSVVSGHVQGLTNTIPLHIQILYNEYQFSASFAVASLLVLFSLITMIIKGLVEWKAQRTQQLLKESGEL
ncbi:sulfate ABC transporter permease subunit CysW [Paenibacillus albiflavus]|uniref:Sulfate ABC transporter permease subunit CysW n=1 Tax=Paenibacillus albiflavus TaxID=2545760 RepID=A0A4R4EQU3_9BACL|nr:sulfate ABC transporter permease subunit CysW [Paenibacillus albiflavus]TCZ80991.1 sulfate ABC transporter permease subunit CysW [Paenibacillus albiflavus]